MGDQAPVEAVVAAFKIPDGALQASSRSRVPPRRQGRRRGRRRWCGGRLIAGPAAWAALGGAAIGGLANRLRDTGFPDARLKEIGEALTPGTSALVAIVEHRWVLDVEQHLRAAAADVMTEAVRADVAAQLEKQASTGS